MTIRGHDEDDDADDDSASLLLRTKTTLPRKNSTVKVVIHSSAGESVQGFFHLIQLNVVCLSNFVECRKEDFQAGHLCQLRWSASNCSHCAACVSSIRASPSRCGDALEQVVADRQLQLSATSVADLAMFVNEDFPPRTSREIIICPLSPRACKKSSAHIMIALAAGGPT